MARRQLRPEPAPLGRAVLLSMGGRLGSPMLAEVLLQRGYELHVVSGRLPGHELRWAKRWHKVDPLGPYEQLLDCVRGIDPSLVLCEMRNVLIPAKARLIVDLGLGDFGTKSGLTSTSKIAFRTALDEAGVSNTRWCLLEDLGSGVLDFPFVIKPDLGTGSRGVHFVENDASLEDALAAMEMHAEDVLIGGEMMAEEFVRGRQFDVEGVVHDGEVHPLTLTEEHYDQVGQFFPSSWYLFSPPIDEGLREGLLRCAAETVKAAGVKAGAFHCEMRVAADGRIIPLDYSNRMGYPKMVSEASGESFFRHYISSMERNEFASPSPEWRTVFQRFLASPAEFEAYLRLEERHPDRFIEFRKQPNKVGGVQRYGRASLRAADFNSLRELLGDLAPTEWADFY